MGEPRGETRFGEQLVARWDGFENRQFTVIAAKKMLNPVSDWSLHNAIE
jgi:hypothetical protein